MKKHGIVVAAILLAAAAHAGPKTITYQGSLTRGDGTPVSGTYPMRFWIYSAPSGGPSLWTETEPSVAVSRGLFSVILGDGSAFNTLFAANANLWLQVAVDLNHNGLYEAGETYGPRQKLAGAAWALDADTLDGLHSGAWATASHNHWKANWTGTSIGLTLKSANDHGFRGQSDAAHKAGVFGSSDAWNTGVGVYGRAGGEGAFGVAAHNVWQGAALGLWASEGDLIRGYSGQFPSTGSLVFSLGYGGTVRAAAYQFTNPTGVYVQYSCHDMITALDNADDTVNRVQYAYVSSGSAPFTADLTCGVHLPFYTRITQMDFIYYDNDNAGFIGATLYRLDPVTGAPEVMASIASTGPFALPAVQTGQTTAISNPTIGNLYYCYYLVVQLRPSASGTGKIRFYSVRLRGEQDRLGY